MARPRSIALLLALMTLLAYLPARRAGFLTLDDDAYLTSNPVVQQGLTGTGLLWALKTSHASNWHPLTWISHMLDCALLGLDPAAHHSVNVLFHTANAVILFMLLLKLTGQLWPSSLVAALFAWHPLVVESVAWLSERKNLLSTFFGLLSLWAYADYAQRVPDSQHAPPDGVPLRRRMSYGLALFLFVLSLLSKPMLVTLPFLMLLLDYWPLGRFGVAGLNLPRLVRLASEKWPFFLLVIPACIATLLAQHHGGMVALLERLPLSVRVCNAGRSYGLYLLKMVCPTGLTILYPYPTRTQLLVGAAAAIPILVGLTWLIWRSRRNYPYLLVGWLWYVGTLVPVIGFVQVGGQGMNDHHAYVPLVGVLIALVFGARDLHARYQVRLSAPATAAGLLLAGCLGLSERQLSYWHNDETLFRHALAVTDNNGPAHNNLGIALAKQGDAADARTHFEEAIRLNPLWADPHNNLGNLLRYSGRPAEALVEYSQAVRLKPGAAAMRCNLGEVLAVLGRSDEARIQFKQASRLDPFYPRPPFDMGRVLLEQGQDAEALDQCREALRLDPNNVGFLTFTAHVLASEQRPELRDGKSALVLAQRACSLAKADPGALDVLAMAFAESGDFKSAQEAATAALQLASQAKSLELEPMRQRLALYSQGQPWRESFLLTNAASAAIP